MRRSICFTEPNIALAGQVSNWKFGYSSATDLPAGTRLKFSMMTKCRVTDWELPNPSSKAKANAIWIETPNQTKVFGEAVEEPMQPDPSYEFILKEGVKAGENLYIIIGSPDPAAKDTNGSRCQNTIQRRRPFNLYIDPKGKGDYKEPEVFSLDVKGNKLHTIKIITPSITEKNRRFDVLVRFEDEFGNLTSMATEGTLIELSYEHLRENLSWKLFVPETGYINLPNLYFNEPGTYRIQLKNLATNEVFFSSPIHCFAENEYHIFWGLLHGESDRYDAKESIESCLRSFRDDSSLSFYASSSFESLAETSNEEWKALTSEISEFNENDRFTTFLGFQWNGTSPGEGLRHIVYSKEAKPLLRKEDSKSNALKKIYRSHIPKDFISIPSFTMAKGLETTFEDFTPDFERVVEIYNAWGSSECTEKEGNTRPIKCKGSKGYAASEKGSILKALKENKRFGFVAGGLDDRGVYAPLFESDQTQYSPGLTAILASEHTREGLFQALQKRQCYATTGARMIVWFHIAGSPMGSELSTKEKPGLNLNRHITAYLAGTTPLSKVEIVRNGEVIKTFTPNALSTEIAYDDFSSLEKSALRVEEDVFSFYYLRVTQEDGHIAWSSPIWIDIAEPKAAPKKKKKAP